MYPVAQSLYSCCGEMEGLNAFADHLAMDVQQKPEERFKVLLLDDDDDFKASLHSFLQAEGFNVVSVSNGVEGVREIIKSDFGVILCDIMMPSLPGDMFYLAVQRMRPHLCKRFIFITGHQGDGKTANFLQKINGVVLPKPFRMEDLLEVIGFVQVRSLLT